MDKISQKQIFIQSTLMGSIKEIDSERKIVKIKISNISYENISIQENSMQEAIKKNTYYIAALIEITLDDKTTHHIVAEDIFVIQNHQKIIVTFYDNYKYITDDIIYDEYKKVVESYKKDNPNLPDPKLTSMYLKTYRDEITKGYKDLYNFYKIKNSQFSQNTLENNRYTKIRKRLSRNILQELLISRIIVEYRNKKVLT